MDSYWSDCISSYDFSTKRIAAEEVWSIEGVASGSLYNVGNSCMVDAMSKKYNEMKDKVSGDSETPAVETETETPEVKVETSTKEMFDVWNYSDGYMMVADAVWTVAATDLSGFTFSFCVSAVEADANCFSGDYTYQNVVNPKGFKAPAYSYAATIADSKAYTAQGTNASSWKNNVDGRAPGIGLWKPTWTAGNPSADPATDFTVDAYWFQPTESVATKSSFRFAKVPVTIHVLQNSSADNAEWKKVDFTLTGAVSLVAGLATVTAALAF